MELKSDVVVSHRIETIRLTRRVSTALKLKELKFISMNDAPRYRCKPYVTYPSRILCHRQINTLKINCAIDQLTRITTPHSFSTSSPKKTPKSASPSAKTHANLPWHRKKTHLQWKPSQLWPWLSFLVLSSLPYSPCPSFAGMLHCRRMELCQGTSGSTGPSQYLLRLLC